MAFFFFFLPPSFFKENCQLLPPGVHFFGGGRLTRERKNTHTHNRLGWACINRFSFFFFFLPSFLCWPWEQVTGLCDALNNARDWLGPGWGLLGSDPGRAGDPGVKTD